MSAITSLSLAAVHKAIEYRLIRSKRVREGRVVHRMLSKSQAVYLRMEAKGLRSLPLASRRQVAQAVEQDPGINVMALSEGSVILIQFKSARQEVATGLRRLAQAVRMVESDTAIMHGAPVYKGTRIPVESIADMLLQGATVAEILDGYPPLSREKVELAPMYCRAFPRKGRPAIVVKTSLYYSKQAWQVRSRIRAIRRVKTMTAGRRTLRSTSRAVCYILKGTS